MENRKHAIIAVCFLIVFFTGTVLIFFWLSSQKSEPLPYRIVTSQSVGGLAPKSKVTFKGLVVGHVESVRFDPSDRSRVIIDFKLQKKAYITHATYAQLTMQGLTGGQSLELKLGEGSSAHLETSNKHPTRVPLHESLLARLEASGNDDLTNIHAILVNAKKMLGAGNRQHLSASIRQIDAASQQLVGMEKQLMPAIKQMPALLKNMRESLEQSHALLANANKVAKQLQEPVKEAGALEDSIQSLARSSQALSRKLDKQTVPDIHALSQSLMRTSRQLDALMHKLNAKPQSLIFGPPTHPPGPGEPGFNGSGKNRNKEGSDHE